MKKLLASVAGLAVIAMAGPAMAQTGQQGNASYVVGVNIEVMPEVSIWAGHENVSLVMEGNDGNNSATFESTLSHINNVAAKISATVTGTLPTPQVPGGGINFFIFDGGNSASAVSAITANAYNPAGALVWNQSTLGNTQDLATVGVGPSIQNRNIVYASASPGELPAVGDYDLLVTWTIAATP